VLAVAVGRDYPSPDERAPDPHRAHALEDDRVRRDAGSDDAPADGFSRQQAARGFDLGQLGHRASVPETPASRAETAGRRT